VRRLQTKGMDYQRTRPKQGVLSIQSGDFSRVILEGDPQYLVTGVDGDRKRRDTMRFQQSFTKSAARLEGTPVSLGGGVYATSSADFSQTAQLAEYSYEVRPGVIQTAQFRWATYVQSVLFSGYRLRGEQMIDFAGTYSYHFAPTSQTVYIKAADTIANYGRRATGGRSAIGFAALFIGRVDASSRPLHDVVLYRMSRTADNDSYLLAVEDFTRPEAEFWPQHLTIVLKDYTLTLLAEIFFRPGEVVSGEDYRPKFWLAYTPNTESFGLFTYADLTSSLFGGALIPSPTPASPDYYGVNAGRQYGADLSATLLTLVAGTAVVGDNRMVMAWQQRMPGGWRQRVATVSLDGGTVSASLVYESDDNPSRASVPFWQTVAHLGNGVVLAKVLSGWPGTGHTVTFRRSMDGGATWGAPFSPSGLGSALLNQFIGRFTVDKPVTDDDPGRVLLPAWDSTRLSYYVYKSEDMGATWTREGKIYTPTEFRRVDSILSDDGGNNFSILVPGPDPRRLPDITLPDRYKDRP